MLRLRRGNQVLYQGSTETKSKGKLHIAKKNFYKSRVEGKIKENPRVWHGPIESVCRSVKKADRIEVPGINPQDFLTTANMINTKIVKVSQSLLPLKDADLPSYLPSLPLPTISEWDVYRRFVPKTCEKFVQQWILNDITPNFDPMQFGSQQNNSTTHNLVSLMDSVYKASEEPGSVCTLITTDFVGFRCCCPYSSSAVPPGSWSET